MARVGNATPDKDPAKAGKSAAADKSAGAAKSAGTAKAKSSGKSGSVGSGDGAKELIKFTHGESFADGSTFEEGLGRVSNLDVENEMEDSFIAYAMSVIVSRALPDAKDGLKPVQRRILFSAYEMGLRPERTHVKSARIIGECFVEGALVSTPNGLVKIESISAGDLVLNPQGAPVLVTQAYANPIGDLVEVELDTGYRILVTPGQLFRVVNDAYEQEWCEARNLLGKRTVRVVAFNASAAELFDSSTPTVTECSEAYTLGLVTSEGYRADRNNPRDLRVRVSMTESEPLSVAESWARSIGLNTKVTTRKPKNPKHKVITTVSFAKNEALLSASAGTSSTKTVPIEVLSNRSLWAPYLAGYFDGDGYVRKNRSELSFVTTSERLARELHAILMSLGITSRFYRSTEKKVGRLPTIKIATEGADAQRLAGVLLPFSRISYKLQGLRRLSTMTSSVGVSGSDLLPCRSLFQFLADKHLGGGWYVDSSGNKFRQGTDGASEVRYGKMSGTGTALLEREFPLGRAERDGWIEKLNKVGSELGHRLESLHGMRFARVVSVKQAPQDVTYDIQVLSDDHAFVVEGSVVHNCMGKLHPHGDTAIYEALVRMAQEWSLNLPLINPQGNFGSRDDGPAASRYTEARLSKPALDMVDEIDEDTVDFRSTYDDSGTEPVVLPAGFPNLLVNGATGIAVGMATNMAPHNLNEVVSVLRAMLADEKITDERLFEMIPAPDFPTGGVIVGIEGVREAFLTGRGAFKLRSVAAITDVTARKKGIVFTELPYTVGPEQVIEKIRELVANKKLLGIADVHNYSDMRNGLKLVVEAKAGYDPEALLAELWSTTPLQVSFSVNNVALVDGAPQTLNLRELCDVYLTHRIDVVSRRTAHRLKKATERAHIISGLVTALTAIERVVAIIRGSKDTESARKSLMKELALDEIQCAAILEMTLRRLTGLEVTKLKGELKELEAAIKQLSSILASKKKLRDLVSAELGEVVARHGGARRSKVLTVDDTVARVGRSAGTPVNAGIKCAIVLGVDGKLSKYVGAEAYGELITGASGIKGGKSGKTGKAGVRQVIDTSTAALMGGVTSSGRVIHFHGSDVSETPTAAKSVISMSANEELIGISPLDAGVLTLVTERGVIKRIKGADLPRKSGNAAINLGERDHLVSAFLGSEEDKWDVYLVTSDAQLLRTPLAAVRTTGASSAGVAGMKVSEDAKVLFAFAGDGGELLVTVANSGKAKVTKIGEYPAKGRNGGGVRCHSLRKGESSLVAAGAIPAGFTGVASGSSGNFFVDTTAVGKRDGGGDQMVDPGVNSIGFALK